MEFANELNFLSVIEEERESADGDSLEESEKLKWKTDYRESKISLSNRIGTGDRKVKEKVASKIPIRQDRLQMPGLVVRKKMKEIQNEQITSFSEEESDKGHEISRVAESSEPDSAFSSLPTENEKEIETHSRVVEISVDESTGNSKQDENIYSISDNENDSENLFAIAPFNKETRSLSIRNDSESLSSEGELERPTSFSSMINTSEGKNREIGLENKPKYSEVEINVSESPQDYYSSSSSREGANEKTFSVEVQGSLQSSQVESIHGNPEKVRLDHEECEGAFNFSLHTKRDSTSIYEKTPTVDNFNQSIDPIITESVIFDVNCIDNIENLNNSEDYISTKEKLECGNLHCDDKTNDFSEICKRIDEKNEHSLSDVGFCSQSETCSKTASDTFFHETNSISRMNTECNNGANSLQKLNESLNMLYLHDIPSCGNNRGEKQNGCTSDNNLDVRLNNSDEKNGLISISEVQRNSELHQKPEELIDIFDIDVYQNIQINVNEHEEKLENCSYELSEEIIPQDFNHNDIDKNEDIPENFSTNISFLKELQLYSCLIQNDLSSRIQDMHDHLCMDIVEYPLECHEPDENILEAPAEFRTDTENDIFFVEKDETLIVSLPQPPSLPEEESPICDNHNTCTTETDETNQRPKPAGERELLYHRPQENRATRESDVSNPISTLGVSLTIDNSTEDNDHVKLGGAGGNVSAFGHVGNSEPIQRHDMLQIGSTERGEIADRIGTNSAVSDPSSSDRRGLRRSVSFNDRFFGGVSEVRQKIDRERYERLSKLEERLGEVLDLKYTSEQYNKFFCSNENSSTSENGISDDVNFSNFLINREENDCVGSDGAARSNRDAYYDAAGTFCQDKMRGGTNCAQDLPPALQFRVTGKEDNNNNLSREVCESEKGEGYESSECPGVFIHHSDDKSYPSIPASSSTAEPSIRAPTDAHLSEFRFPKLSSSIHGESGVPAPAPGCSPTKTAAPKGCVASTQNSTSGITSCSTGEDDPVDEDVRGSPSCGSPAEIRKLENLRWSFKNGRLVFDSDNKLHPKDKSAATVSRDLNSNEVNLDSIESTDSIVKLSSREVNKRIDENKSRLRYLEEKLKRAGLSGDSRTCLDNKKVSSEFKSDVVEQVVDESESTLWEELKENENCGSIPLINQEEVDDKQQQTVSDYREPYAEDLTKFTGGEEFCQFDVSQVESFSPVLNGYCLVYDELDEESDSDEEFHVISLQEDPNSSEEFYVLSKNTNDKMGTDSDRPKHNPDTENLRSLLKRPGKNRDKKSNRVVFNENKNEFFDADYIILIREECDYDDEDDDSVCTCNQHEMVRLTCCEPNCNCSVYDGFDPTPQSPKFAPPLEFVDAVTLSPPEGYKDMELGEQQLLALQQMARRGQQRRAVCRECSATHTQDDDEDGEGSQSDEGGGRHSDSEDPGEREKTDQSQQTTPTTPDNCTNDSPLHDFAVDRSPMTFEKAQSSDEESVEQRTDSSARPNVPAGGSPISGILKGGKLWKQPSLDNGPGGNTAPNKSLDLQQNTDSSITSDEEGCSRRFVRFIESDVKDQRGGCDGASDDHTEEDSTKNQNAEDELKKKDVRNNSAPHDSTEMMLTFKLGNHVLISNNSLKPNSAVRQLFPCTKPNVGNDEEAIQQYVVTAESLKAFEEAKRSKLPQIIQNGETDESIKKAIERNTLRRSLIRYEPRNKKNQPKTDNSLVERIKQLTCDVDDDQLKHEMEEVQIRASPTGEEARNSPEITAIKQQEKSFSPSSSSTASSNSSSVSSTYKKLTDLFNKKTDKVLDGQNNLVNNSVQETKTTPTLPDLGNGPHELDHVHFPVSRISSCTNESRKQFLASLAPLTACVSGIGSTDDYFYQMNNRHDQGGQRTSVASSVGTEYSLEDIDEALRNDQDDTKRITPDVLAGTPSASESGDELAMFVQQDAGRIERIKKKYQAESNKEEDDEHDDYGFNKRPSVRGIKPRFGTTTQIIQQIQNQMQPPDPAGRVSWPYYSESGLSGVDNSKPRNTNQNPYQYPPAAPDDFKPRGYPNAYRPTSLTEEHMYQSGQVCKQMYRINGNSNNYPAVVKVGARCNDTYQSLPRQKSAGRPLSPPPLEISKTYHQTMVYIPYNHIEGCQGTGTPNMYYHQSDYARVTNQNQINKRFIEPIYQQRYHMHLEDHHYSTNMATSNFARQMVRIPYPPQLHGMNCRSESPLPGQYSTARSTQTPVPNCNYYTTQRYRPVVGSVWQGDPAYVSKMNRHSFPMGQRYTTSDTSTDTDSSQGVVAPVQNGYRQSIEISVASQKEALGNSPVKPKFTERGVPEGAASVSPPDTIKIGQSSSTMTSPTSPQNVSMQTQKPLFYAMNV